MMNHIRRGNKVRCFAVVSGLLFTLAMCSTSVWAENPVRPVDQAKKRAVEKTAAPPPSTTTKIVGGHPVPSGKFPFQVALLSSGTQEGFELFGQFCGGSLIDRNWVLTAAHCVPNTAPGDIDVYVGSHVLPGDGVAIAGGVRSYVDDIIVHEKYDPATNDNDIALLHLTGPIPPDVKTARVATAELDKKYAFPMGDAVVIGWGRTTEGSSSSPNLMRVWVDIQDRDLCESNYQSVIPGVDITDNMLCAGMPSGGMDSCQGDSGGFLGAPLGGGEYVQLGVVSWGVGCARPNLFGVYTRVGNYADWISGQMASH